MTAHPFGTGLNVISDVHIFMHTASESIAGTNAQFNQSSEKLKMSTYTCNLLTSRHHVPDLKAQHIS